ncbi:ATP-binding protein [Psychrobacter sp. SCQQ22]|uniref:ATP-binding protein n=1 Tax=Psychrobacter sp. SCQQ22 TaxID=2792059 RepID=UPI0018CF0FA5|nr:ATP-binding protein [Psychrobacter sp. SCQQ22]MBH0086294.1 ATP-binding protein [Psychrobacter sp. SCQQ22]
MNTFSQSASSHNVLSDNTQVNQYVPITQSNTQGQSPNRLLRVALINSYLKGQAHLLNVDNNCILTGHNSAGKTTLMGAIAPFYGVPLSAIARKSEVNKSFIEFYLPYDNSYIVYEYVRDGQSRCVILSSQDKKQIFNFINGSYKDDWFIGKRNDELYFKGSVEVMRAIKSQGLQVSSNISQLEYEAIISNCPMKRLKITSTQARRTISKYRPDYALTSDPHATFFGFSPIVSNVFQTQLEFDDICAFLVEAMKTQDMLSSDELKLDAVNIDTAKWVRQRETWQQIEALKPKFETLTQSLSDNIAHQQQLADIRHKASILLSKIGNEIIDKSEENKALDNQYSNVEREASDKETMWYSAKGKLDANIKLTANEVVNLENKKEAFEQGAQDKYKYEPMFKLKERVAKIDSLQSQKSNKQQTLKIYQQQLKEAEANLDKIQAIFKDEVRNLEKTHDEAVNRIDKAKGVTDFEFSEKQRSIENRLSKEKQRLQSQFRIQSENFKTEISRIGIEIATKQSEASNLSFSQSSKNAIDNNLSEIASLRLVLKENQTKLKKGQEEKVNLRDEIDSQLNQQRRINDTINKHQDSKTHLESLVQGDTLFSFLIQSEANDKLYHAVNQIRKTMNPALLNRADLTPDWLAGGEGYSVVDTGHEGLYGLSLHTNAIPTPDIRTHADIAQEILNHEQQVESSNAELAELENTLNKLDKRKRQNSQEFTQLQLTEQKIENEIEALEDHGRYLHIQAEEDRQKRISEMQNQIKMLADQLTNLNIKLDALDLEEQNQLSALDETHTINSDKLNQEKQARLDDLKTQLDKAKDEHKTLLAEVTERKNQAVENEGYDPSIINSINTDIEFLDSELLTAERAKRRIDDYKVFLEKEYTELGGLESKKNELEKSLIAQQHLHEKYAAETRQLLSELQAKITKTAERLNVLATDKTNLTSHLKKLELTLNSALIDVNTNLSHANSPEAESRLLEEDFHLQTERILRSMQSNIERADTTTKQGVKLVDTIKKPFNDNESMFQALLSQSDIISRTTETNWFLQSRFFMDYMNNEHESKKEMIVGHYIVEAEKINNFKYDLDNADSNLNKFTRNINKNCSDICDNLNALAIEEFKMSISSSIKDNEWYKVLDDFSEAYDNWRGSERIHQPMPSEYLLASLDKVQHFIGQNKLNVKFAQQFSMDLMVKQHGQAPRTATKTNSFKALSSNGTMRIAQLIIYLSLLSMISTATNTELKLFIDEIGVLDPQNTQELLELLRSQKVSAMCAAPQVVDDAVIPLFTNNIACSRDKSNTYRLSQTDDLSSLTQEAIMEAHGVFDL